LDIVSDADLRFTISIQCSGSGRREEIELIERWAKQQTRRLGSSAANFVKAMDEVASRPA
jgi:hypothetical protein